MAKICEKVSFETSIFSFQKIKKIVYSAIFFLTFHERESRLRKIQKPTFTLTNFNIKLFQKIPSLLLFVQLKRKKN